MTSIKTIFIDANGCAEARLDAQKAKNLVSKTGAVCTDDFKVADVIIFYACGHLSSNEQDSIRNIKKILREKSQSSILIVGGCLPKINPLIIRRIYDGIIAEPENLDYIPKILDENMGLVHSIYANQLCSRTELTSSDPSSRQAFKQLNVFLNKVGLALFRPEQTWYIKIISGCREKCTYCSDRLAFEGCKSQPMDSIISQFEVGLSRGFRTFGLLGRDLGSYGCDLDYDLPTLLANMVRNHKENFEIQLYNLSPKAFVKFYPRLKESFSSGKVSQIGYHIQSGSDRILKLMGRDYSSSQSLETIKRIKKDYPNISVSTSIIIGFPTETEQDFDRSLSMLDSTLFDHVDLYVYEERPNLPSLNLPGAVPSKIKVARYKKMRRKIFLINIKTNIRKRRTAMLVRNLINFTRYWF